jgi:RNA polymerase sigma-70 factor (ECF subfamily)
MLPSARSSKKGSGGVIGRQMEHTESGLLVARVRAGDQAAATRLVELLLPTIRRIVWANLPRTASPDDLCQEVFMKLFSRLDQYAGTVPFEHWASRIALNTCRDHLRSQQRSRELRWSDLDEAEAAVLENVSQVESAVDETEAVAARELADRLLEGLGPEDRVIVRMIDLEQHSAAEVRAVTGLSITNIRVRLFRARIKLRKAMRQLQETRSTP